MPKGHRLVAILVSFAIISIASSITLHAEGNPVPLINQPLSPSSAAPGGATFTLTVNGAGFAPESVVEWDGNPLFTLVLSSSQLTATVPAANIAVAGTASVTVVNPGAPASNVVFFPIASSRSTVGFGFLDLSETYSSPNAIATGDFNGDGIQDLIVAAYDGLDILLGNGDGTFQAPILTSESGGGSVALGDFNNDGRLDVIYSYYFYGQQIFLGNGDGTLTPGTTYNNFNDDNSLFVGDFNGDGKLDFGVGGCCYQLDIYEGNGDGTFNPNPLTSPYTLYNTPAVGDFDGDGTLDLAGVDGGCGIQVLLGDGDASFQGGATYPLNNSCPNYVTTADLNGDGLLDLVATTSNNSVAILFNNGNGTFGAELDYPTNNDPSSLLVGDFNNDGKTDLATLDYNFGSSGFVSVLLGNGDGTFQNRSDFATDPDPVGLTMADFNGDGQLDLAVVSNIYNSGSVSILLQGGISLAPGFLAYNQQNVGTASPAQTVTLANYSSSTLNITSIGFSGANPGDYGQTNNCGATLGTGQGCTINVTFTPTGTGTRTANLSITDSGQFSPQLVTLTGTAVAPSVMLSLTSLTFGLTPVGAEGLPQSVTLTNTGTATLNISSITTSAGFVTQNNCGSMVYQNNSCNITVQFNPQAGGAQTGTLSINDDAIPSPQTVSLSGTATVVLVSPIGVYFGGEALGGSSPTVTATLTNKGISALTINSISLSGADPGDFAQTNTCGSSLGAGSNCSINLAFTPTVIGARSAVVTISDSDPYSPQSIGLSGTGLVAGSNITLSPSSLAFANTHLGSSSAVQSVTLTNYGTMALSITSLTGSGDFTQTNNCGGTVPAGGGCEISVGFKPTHAGVRTGSVSITDNGPGSPQTINLTGTGIAQANSPTLMADFDGDGKTDISFWHPENGTWNVTLSSTGQIETQEWGTPGDIPVADDYDGDGKADYAVWRPSNGTWYIRLSSQPGQTATQQYGMAGDIPVPHDYDGDGKADYAVWRPSNGTWYVMLSSQPGKTVSQQYGAPGDIPVPGDYDGDGKTDYAVFRPSNGTWYYIASSTGKHVGAPFGLTGDIPVQGDYDGDGKTDYAVWQPSAGIFSVLLSSNGQTQVQNLGYTGQVATIGDFDGDHKADYVTFMGGEWQIVYSSTGYYTFLFYGQVGDLPATRFASLYTRNRHIANFDGDRQTDYAVWRPSSGMWYVLESSEVYYTITQEYGASGDIPVPGDYDGDGKTDYAVFRPSNGTWYYIASSTGNHVSVPYGLLGDIPVPGDYDGDGKTDYAVFRPSTGTWYYIASSTGKHVSAPCGLTGDIPVPGDYDGDGKTDYAVFRPSNGTWYYIASSTGSHVSVPYGLMGDIPVPGDYDGDGKTDYAVFRPSTGTWYYIASSTGQHVSVPFGTAGDIPVAKDYDGDEKTDIAVWRPSDGSWYYLSSAYGWTGVFGLGVSGDIPVNKPTGQ